MPCLAEECSHRFCCWTKLHVEEAKRSILAGAEQLAKPPLSWRSVQASSQHSVGDALNELDSKAAAGVVPPQHSSRDDPVLHFVAGVERSERPIFGVNAANAMLRSRDKTRRGWRSTRRRRLARGVSRRREDSRVGIGRAERAAPRGSALAQE